MAFPCHWGKLRSSHLWEEQGFEGVLGSRGTAHTGEAGSSPLRRQPPCARPPGCSAASLLAPSARLCADYFTGMFKKGGAQGRALPTVTMRAPTGWERRVFSSGTAL